MQSFSIIWPLVLIASNMPFAFMFDILISLMRGINLFNYAKQSGPKGTLFKLILVRNVCSNWFFWTLTPRSINESALSLAWQLFTISVCI